MDALGKQINISLDYKHPLISEIQENNTSDPYSGETAHLKYIPKLLRRKTQEVADVLQPRNSYKFMYILMKETNQTGDGIRHKFLNASRISEISKVIEITTSEIEDKKVRKMKDRLKQEFLTGSLNNTSVKISESLNNSKNNNSQQVKFFQKRNDDVQTNKYSNVSGILMMKIHSKKSDNISIRLINTETQNVKSKTDNQTLDSHTDEQKWESEEDALLEAAKFGLQAMHDLYYIQEPKLYSMGKRLKKIH